MEENTNIIENTVTLEATTGDKIYSVAQNIHSMLSVLTFIIVVIFLFTYLKSIFKVKK